MVDSDLLKSGRLEICVEEAEMVIDHSTPEFVFRKKPKTENPEKSQKPQDYKVTSSLVSNRMYSVSHSGQSASRSNWWNMGTLFRTEL